jgi:hypothetical protein
MHDIVLLLLSINATTTEFRGGGDEQPPLADEAPPSLLSPWLNSQVALSKVACVCSTAAPACCPKSAGKIAMDWWADDSRRAHFFFLPGPYAWTTVTDMEQSHQLGNSYEVSFNDPGLFPQGQPPCFAAGWYFVAPSSDCACRSLFLSLLSVLPARRLFSVDTRC